MWKCWVYWNRVVDNPVHAEYSIYVMDADGRVRVR